MYTSKIQPHRIDICRHCAGAKDSLVTLNAYLKAHEGPYSIVSPICENCIAMGRHIIVRAARQNAQAKRARLYAHVAIEARRQEKDKEEVDA